MATLKIEQAFYKKNNNNLSIRSNFKKLSKCSRSLTNFLQGLLNKKKFK